MILSVTLNPSVDQSYFVERLTLHDTNRAVRAEMDAGGKGVNLSRIVSEMGAKTMATGFLGGGPGAFVRHVLTEQGVSHDYVEISEDTRTNFSVEVEGSNQPPTTFNAPGPHIRVNEWEDLLAKVDGYCKGAEWLTLGGSVPPGAPSNALNILIDLGKSQGLKILLDADGAAERAGIDQHPDFIKPNSKEATRLLGYPIVTQGDAKRAADQLYEKLGGGHRIVVVSRGANGAILRCHEGSFVGLAPKVRTESTIGSGDSLLGAMLAKMQLGEPVPEAFRWGLAAGAATACTNGCEIGQKPLIEELYKRSTVVRVG